MPTSSAIPGRSLAGGRAELEVTADHAVLTIETVVDHAMVDALLRELIEVADRVPSGGLMTVDLRLAGVFAPGPLQRLVEAVRADLGAQCRLVIDRLSAKVLLERWGIADTVTLVTELP